MEGDFGGRPGMGKSYLIGTGPDNLVKLDVYYSMEPFLYDIVREGNIRLASIEEIIAMKLDIFLRAARKKDFWDLHGLLGRYDIREMLGMNRRRSEWTHDEELIIKNLANFSRADLDPDPICLLGKEWIFIREDFEAEIKKTRNYDTG